MSVRHMTGAVETSIYVKHDKKGQKIGRALYDALEVQLHRQNIVNVKCLHRKPCCRGCVLDEGQYFIP